MALRKLHKYELHLEWTGNQGSGTSAYNAYSRNHSAGSDKASNPLLLSSDPAFRGDPTRFSPEQLLVASLSSCHMLWVLHLCSSAGIAVAEYDDEPIGEMTENEDGSGEFTRVTLQPRIELNDPSRASELARLHEEAHKLCFISRSVNFPVSLAPRMEPVKTL